MRWIIHDVRAREDDVFGGYAAFSSFKSSGYERVEPTFVAFDAPPIMRSRILDSAQLNNLLSGGGITITVILDDPFHPLQ